ncbi:MAG: NeuD/PglB/VioB family sugar acetyltransferase [bacterium]
MKKKNLYLFPFGGNAIEAIDCIDKDLFDFKGFIDDDENIHGTSWNNFPISGKDSIIKDKTSFLLAVQGSPTTYTERPNIIKNLGLPIDRFTSIIHPKSNVSKYSCIGNNTLIMGGVFIGSDVKIGSHVIILPNTVIHHHADIQDYSIIGSQVVVAGHSGIGENCYIGSGSKIINNIKIGHGSLVGMGSVVLKSIKANSKVAGNPARYL